MGYKTHYLHLYNRHKLQVVQGKKFHRQFKAINYKHRIDAQGWFDTMTTEIDVDLHDIWQIFDANHGWLMREVNAIVDNPVVPIWEGFISRITAELPNGTLTIGIENLANRVTIVYTSAGATTQSTQTNDTTSIALYGSKTMTLEMGDNGSGGTGMQIDLQSKTLAQNAYPKASFLRGSNPRIKITLECLGVYHTLKWDSYAVTNTTSNLAWVVVAVFQITGYTAPFDFTGFNSSTMATGNGSGVFYKDTDPATPSGAPKYFTANTAFNTTCEKRRGQTHWDKILQVTEAGDGTNDYVVGIRPTDPNTRERNPYYNPADVDVYYTTKAFGDGKIRNRSGGVVDAWTVVPNRKIRINDILQGYNGVSSLPDPREIWIRAVDYDSSGRNGEGDVQWITKDDPTLTGEFQINNYVRPTDRRFGADRRYF
jgi:hypothetical protein